MGRATRWAIVALALLVFVLPAAVTTAFLTDEETAQQSSAGAGKWCSVPAPEHRANVYRLADMPTQGGTRLQIIPVVHNGEFGQGGVTNTLGVRLWACRPDALVTTSTIKITAWRNNVSNPNPRWLAPRGPGFAGQRLDPAAGFGAQLATLHRTGSSLIGDAVAGADRSRYSWLVSSGRTKSATTAFPSCLTLLCTISLNPVPSLATAFTADPGTGRAYTNSVTFLGAKYWSGSGTFTPNVRHDLTMQAYSGTAQPPFPNGGGPTSQDGRQVQWVVMEWWGANPTNDLMIEVFIQ